MNRRDFLKRSALTGAGLTLAPGLARAPEAAAATRSRCLWGAFARPRGDQSPATAILDLEAMIGRRLGLTRN